MPAAVVVPPELSRALAQAYPDRRWAALSLYPMSHGDRALIVLKGDGFAPENGVVIQQWEGTGSDWDLVPIADEDLAVPLSLEASKILMNAIYDWYKGTF